MRTKVLIQNLKCGGCANTIYSKLEQIDGITEILVSNDDDSVEFSYSDEKLLNSVEDTLSNLGYPVAGETNTLGKKAKSYVSCAVGRFKS